MKKDDNNVKDLLPNTVRQKDEKPHTVLQSEVCLQSEKAFKNLSSVKELLNFFCKLIFIFLLFLGMAMYANQF